MPSLANGCQPNRLGNQNEVSATWRNSEKAESYSNALSAEKSQKQVKKLIAGPGVYICDECIDLCNEIIEEELADNTEVDFDEVPKPSEIFAFLNEYIIGQERTKKILSVAVYNHYKRVQFGQSSNLTWKSRNPTSC